MIAVAALVIVSSAAAAPPATVTVTIDKAAFREQSVSAHVGDTIEWINKDIFDHTATAKSGEFKVEVPAGKKARAVLRSAGTLDYYCEYHPNMTAKVVVTVREGSLLTPTRAGRQ